MSGELTLEPVPYDDPVVRDLEGQVQAEYLRRYGGADDSVTEVEQFASPSGVFLVGWVHGQAVATGGLRRHDEHTAEIKRMYVVCGQRGRGFARMTLAALEGWAVDLGYRAIVLETGTRQPEAIALYASSGYQRIEPFGLYRSSPMSRAFRKDF